MNKKLTGACASAALGLLLAGCGAMPSTVASPYMTAPAAEKAKTSPHEGRYRTGPDTDAPTVASQGGRVLPMERTVGGVLEQLSSHRTTWQLESDKLASNVDSQRNLTFGGALLGGIGILIDSSDPAKAGAAIAGTSTLFGDHFAWSTQAENYRLAADSVSCMHSAVRSLGFKFWEATYDDEGLPKNPRGFYTALAKDDAGRKAASDGYDKLLSMFSTIHESVLAVRERLASKQRKVVLATPSASELAGAIRSQYDAEQKGQKVGSDAQGTKTSAVGAPSEQQIAAVTDDEARQQFTLTAKKNEKNEPEQPSAQQLLDQKRAIAARRKAEARQRLAEAAGMEEPAFTKALTELDTERLEQAYKLPEQLDTCAKRIGT